VTPVRAAPAVALLLGACAVRQGLAGIEEASCADGGARAGAGASVPEPYLGMANPEPTVNDVALGREVYARACVSCHGAGESGELARPFAVDYLYWRVSEGGAAPFCSAMPRYRDTMANRDRWRVVAYVASLAPR